MLKIYLFISPSSTLDKLKYVLSTELERTTVMISLIITGYKFKLLLLFISRIFQQFKIYRHIVITSLNNFPKLGFDLTFL